MNQPLSLLAALALAAPALAQNPIYVDLSPGSIATDVTVANGEVVVVGESSSGIFRWTMATGEASTGESTGGNGNIRVSQDGTRIGATIGIGIRAGIWIGGATWLPAVGIGTCGSDESSGYGISGDGTTVAGLGWTNCSGRAFTWSQAGGPVNLGPGSQPSSRANDINYDGSVVVGWKETGTGPRYASRWLNGTQAFLVDNGPGGPYALGEAFATNSSGNKVVGFRIWNSGLLDAWIWDSVTGITRLPNRPGFGTQAMATDLTDDGSIIVGHTGGNILGTNSIIWIGGQPQNLHTYLTSLGTAGIAGYNDLGLVTGISRDGGAICGVGTGFVGGGQPSGGWVVIFPSALGVGSAFCSGDGTATACPCGNSGGAGRGCASSVNPNGGLLRGTGFASLASDTLILTGEGLTNAPALYFQGTAQFNGGMGALFGDGLRCAGGTVVRLGTKTSVANTSSYPGAGDPSVSVRGNVIVPGTRTYQAWYRNAAAFCTGATFNLTNGLEISWGA